MRKALRLFARGFVDLLPFIVVLAILVFTLGFFFPDVHPVLRLFFAAFVLFAFFQLRLSWGSLRLGSSASPSSDAVCRSSGFGALGGLVAGGCFGASVDVVWGLFVGCLVGALVGNWFEYVWVYRGESIAVSRAFSWRSLEYYVRFVLIGVCVAAARFLESDLVVFCVFLATLVVYLVRGYDCRLLVGSFMVLLVFAAVFLALGNEYFANKVAVWAYYFLVIGVVGLVVEYVRESRKGRVEEAE
jgi:hypothetical protein